MKGVINTELNERKSLKAVKKDEYAKLRKQNINTKFKKKAFKKYRYIIQDYLEKISNYQFH